MKTYSNPSNAKRAAASAIAGLPGLATAKAMPADGGGWYPTITTTEQGARIPQEVLASCKVASGVHQRAKHPVEFEEPVAGVPVPPPADAIETQREAIGSVPVPPLAKTVLVPARKAGKTATAQAAQEPAGTDTPAEATPAASAPRSGTAAAMLLDLIAQPGGARMGDICTKLQWARVTTRGAISLLTRKYGYKVTRTGTGDNAVYTATKE